MTVVLFTIHVTAENLLWLAWGGFAGAGLVIFNIKVFS